MTATFGTGAHAAHDRRRRAMILGGSAVLHAAILGLIGMGLLEDRLAPPPFDDAPIYLDIEPRPLLRGETARPAAPSRVQPVESRALNRAATDLAVAPQQKDEEEDAPSPPAPRMAGGTSGAAGPAAPADANPWTYRPESQAAAVARSLRTGTGGCRIMDGHLSAAEQALCDERFNAGAAEAARRHPLGARTRTASEARRDAEFARQGAAALENYEVRRRPLSGGTGNVLSSPDCPGGNLAGSCAGAHLRPEFQYPEENPVAHARRRD